MWPSPLACHPSSAKVPNDDPEMPTREPGGPRFRVHRYMYPCIHVKENVIGSTKSLLLTGLRAVGLRIAGGTNEACPQRPASEKAVLLFSDLPCCNSDWR